MIKIGNNQAEREEDRIIQKGLRYHERQGEHAALPIPA
jgi:hypothetical protein